MALGHGAIGQFAIGQAADAASPGAVTMDMWYPQLSEPVRNRLKAHRVALSASGAIYVQANFVPFGWIYPLSEPVRSKRWKSAAYYSAWFMDRFIPTGPGNFPWFQALSEPKRFKRGLLARYQKSFFGPDRLLPTPNVTMTMAATETNSDEALFALNVVGSSLTTGTPRAQVSITEVPIVSGGGVGIAED